MITSYVVLPVDERGSDQAVAIKVDITLLQVWESIRNLYANSNNSPDYTEMPLQAELIRTNRNDPYLLHSDQPLDGGKVYIEFYIDQDGLWARVPNKIDYALSLDAGYIGEETLNALIKISI